MALTGFSVSKPSSIAYSHALCRIARFRLTVEGAAGLPSRRVAAVLRTVRAVLASARSETGLVLRATHLSV
jgi:hypothetical protein